MAIFLPPTRNPGGFFCTPPNSSVALGHLASGYRYRLVWGTLLPPTPEIRSPTR